MRRLARRLFLLGKPFIKLSVCAVSFLAPLTAEADIIFSLNSHAPIASSNNISSGPASAENYYDLQMMLQFRRESRFYLTLGYLFLTSITPISTTASSTLNSDSPYAGITMFFSENMFSWGLFLSPYNKATYATGSSEAETWAGTAYYTKFSVHSNLVGSLFLDMSLAYYSASFTSKSGTAVSTVNEFNQSVFAPLIGLHYSF